jgi:anti-sigma regulatory factor (Ser/Thr protein kinase)
MRSLPVATMRLPAHPASSRAARSFAAEQLRSWGCDQAVDDATLLVSELVTNAVLHARAPVDVVVRKSRTAIRIEVFDEGTGVPQPAFSDIDALHGRGLGLVQAIAQRWGVNEDCDGGKTVWFEIAL